MAQTETVQKQSLALTPEEDAKKKVFEAYTKESLTGREFQVFLLLVQGNSNRSIANLLDIKTGTVKIYVSRLFRLLHLTSRIEAYVYAEMLGVSPGVHRETLLTELRGITVTPEALDDMTDLDAVRGIAKRLLFIGRGLLNGSARADAF